MKHWSKVIFALCLSSALSAADIAMPIIYGVFGDMGLGWLKRAEGGWPAIWILCIVTVIMLLKHVQNVYRIATKTEMPFNYLWSKDKEGERARIEANREKLRQKKLAKQQQKGEKA